MHPWLRCIYNRKMKIVIVDDDSLVAMSLKTILSSDSEIEVLATGSSGKDAVRLYDELKPDVLLMDIRMAEMTGLEAGSIILEKYKDARKSMKLFTDILSNTQIGMYSRYLAIFFLPLMQ